MVVILVVHKDSGNEIMVVYSLGSLVRILFGTYMLFGEPKYFKIEVINNSNLDTHTVLTIQQDPESEDEIRKGFYTERNNLFPIFPEKFKQILEITNFDLDFEYYED